MLARCFLRKFFSRSFFSISSCCTFLCLYNYFKGSELAKQNLFPCGLTQSHRSSFVSFNCMAPNCFPGLVYLFLWFLVPILRFLFLAICSLKPFPGVARENVTLYWTTRNFRQRLHGFCSTRWIWDFSERFSTVSKQIFQNKNFWTVWERFSTDNVPRFRN